MKKLVVLSLMIFLASLCLTHFAFAPKTIVLDQIEISEIRLRKVEVYSGEPPVGEWKWQISAQYRMQNLVGDSVDKEKAVILSDPQTLQIRNFLKPFIDAIRADVDISNVINFTDPPE